MATKTTSGRDNRGIESTILRRQLSDTYLRSIPSSDRSNKGSSSAIHNTKYPQGLCPRAMMAIPWQAQHDTQLIWIHSILDILT